MCLLQKISTKNILKIRLLAQLIGKLVASFPGSMYGQLYYRNLEFNKQFGLAKSHGDYENYINLFASSKKEILWWIKNLPDMTNKIAHDPPTITIYSDASDIAWGASSSDKETGGPWSDSESKYHINIKKC